MKKENHHNAKRREKKHPEEKEHLLICTLPNAFFFLFVYLNDVDHRR
jgi:hypothetical protein